MPQMVPSHVIWCIQFTQLGIKYLAHDKEGLLFVDLLLISDLKFYYVQYICKMSYNMM